MQELIHKLGIDWRLLVSQAVNFLLLLLILRAWVYKPLLKVMKERRLKIEEGLKKAEAADSRLHEINLVAKEKMKEAEEKALGILRETEARAKKTEAQMLDAAKKKEQELVAESERIIRGKEREAEERFAKEAATLVKAAIQKTVELAPGQIDEALVKKAVGSLSRRRSSTSL